MLLEKRFNNTKSVPIYKKKTSLYLSQTKLNKLQNVRKKNTILFWTIMFKQ